MFVFGDPVDNAKILLDTVLSVPGPTGPDVHYDEMSEQDLRNLNAYLHVTLRRAIQESMGDDTIEVLTEWYDDVFTALAGVSERFRDRVLDGSVFPPGGQATRPKYLAIVKEASES